RAAGRELPGVALRGHLRGTRLEVHLRDVVGIRGGRRGGGLVGGGRLRLFGRGRRGGSRGALAGGECDGGPHGERDQAGEDVGRAHCESLLRFRESVRHRSVLCVERARAARATASPTRIARAAATSPTGRAATTSPAVRREATNVRRRARASLIAVNPHPPG